MENNKIAAEKTFPWLCLAEPNLNHVQLNIVQLSSILCFNVPISKSARKNKINTRIRTQTHMNKHEETY